MPRRLNRFKHHLQFLSVCDSNTCKDVIKGANRELVNTICECALNVLKGNVPLTPTQKKHLAKYKGTLRKLVLKGSTRKKKHILQTGRGLLPFLLGPVLGVLSSLLFNK